VARSMRWRSLSTCIGMGSTYRARLVLQPTDSTRGEPRRYQNVARSVSRVSGCESRSIRAGSWSLLQSPRHAKLRRRIAGREAQHQASISPVLRRRHGVPYIQNSATRAPGHEVARRDSLRCFRNPGPNFFAGLIAASKHRPAYRRQKNEGSRSFMRCRSGLRSVENFFEKRHAHSRAVYRRPFVLAGREISRRTN
jgi:hypothetical protein